MMLDSDEEVKMGEGQKKNDRRLIVYFHGNSEDIGHNLEFLQTLSEMYSVDCLCMEYPGYSVFTHQIIDGQ